MQIWKMLNAVLWRYDTMAVFYLWLALRGTCPEHSGWKKPLTSPSPTPTHPTISTDRNPRCHIYPKKSRTAVGEDISGLDAALLCPNSTGKPVQSSQCCLWSGMALNLRLHQFPLLLHPVVCNKHRECAQRLLTIV